MSQSIKPTADRSVADLSRSLDLLQQAIRKETAADGSADMGKVSWMMRHTGYDPEHHAAYMEGRRVAGKIWSEVWDRFNEPCDNVVLSRAQVKSVMAAIEGARAAIEAADTDHNGIVSLAEAGAAAALPGKSPLETMARNQVWKGDQERYRQALATFRSRVHYAELEVPERKRIDELLQSVVKDFCESREAAAAVTWAVRREWATDLARYARSTGSRVDSVYDMRSKLRDAAEDESLTDWLSHLLHAHAAGEEPSLTDRQVRAMLETDDLTSFVAQCQGDIRKALGGSYTSIFLTGKDMPEQAYFNDPDRLYPKR